MRGRPLSIGIVGWTILAGVLFAATAWFVASEIQILILTLSGQFGPIPASQPAAGYVSTSTPVLPQGFFSNLFVLVGLVFTDLATVRVLRGKIHNSKLGIDKASTESSQLR